MSSCKEEDKGEVSDRRSLAQGPSALYRSSGERSLNAQRAEGPRGRAGQRPAQGGGEGEV